MLGIKGKYLPRQAIGRNLPSCPGNTLTNRKKAVRVVALQRATDLEVEIIDLRQSFSALILSKSSQIICACRHVL